MFFTIPPAKPVALPISESVYLKAVTLRVEVAPSGYANVYSDPFKGLPARFDAEHPQQRIETYSPHIAVQLMDGAESFRLELLGFEEDAEAKREAAQGSDVPPVIRWR